LRVQPHLKKCFEGIAKLEFDTEKKIHAMYSIEGEKIDFTKVIDPMAAKGKVEEWLEQVEKTMLASVKKVVEDSYTDYQKTPRDQWILKWAGQAVLVISQLYWTHTTEECMQKSGMPGLKAHYEKLREMLQDTVLVVRKDISALQRSTIEALIVLDVHATDLIKTDLVDKGVSVPSHFMWISQLRYYWEDHTVLSRITISVLDYNYEYLGNSARLVVTPLTDRCYRTLCGAIYLNYGGAPEGPAGTGKTETVKDLSKALARQCIVFNCSDTMEVDFMVRFFKGLAQCGAWSCFDEFNRIQLEVLSVIAQQVQTIQKAIANKQEQFVFEECLIPIKWTCNCFITMNPGYAGRSELPDNLKALFRSVAMMVPDYTLIARISLLSFGYSDADSLATKITTTYTLCSE
jgi:dynein heavy chain